MRRTPGARVAVVWGASAPAKPHTATSKNAAIPEALRCILRSPSSAQPRCVILAGVFFPVLAEASVRGLVVRMRPQLFDVDVDAQSGGRRQIDPAVLHRQ